MKKTTLPNLSNRLAQYGALSLAIAGISSASGQIIYHDIDPDFDGSMDYLLNLNPMDGDNPTVEDAIDDFRIFSSGSTAGTFVGMQIQAYGGNSIIGSSQNAGAFIYPFALNSGDPIISNGNSSVWFNSQYQTLVFSYSSTLSCYGKFCSASDKYLGLKFDIGGNTHYGWVKLDVDASDLTWSVKEYAFNMTPDEVINAGQTILGINDNFFEKVKIVALNKTIAIYNVKQETEYTLFSMNGKKLLNGINTSTNHIIEANTVSNGIYILELKDSNTNAVFRKKIVL